MGDQDYQEYLECVYKAQTEANEAKNVYEAEVKAAREAFLQKQSTETEYYNSDDEDEPLCTAAPSYPNQQYIQNPINYNSIAQNNQYLSKQNCYDRCTPKSTTSYTPAFKTSYQEKPTYTYSQKICNLKYIPPPAKKTFTLAYKKPIAKVYVYNNYIQNLDNCNKGPYYEKKECCIPSTTKATYK